MSLFSWMNVARHRLLSGCLSRPEHVRLDGDSAVNFKSADVKTGEITDEIVSLLAFRKKTGRAGPFSYRLRRHRAPQTPFLRATRCADPRTLALVFPLPDLS
jgi:hypothetical protein